MSIYSKWMDDVGEIFLSDTECFWRFPRYMFLNRELCITSPWFCRENETWRLVKAPKEKYKDYVSLYLWKKISRCQTNLQCTFKAYIKSYYGSQNLIYASCSDDNVNPEFGCVCYDFFNLLEKDKIDVISRHGLVKIFFEIQKKEDSTDPLSCSSATAVGNDDCENDDKPENINKLKLKGFDRLVQNLKSLMLDEESSDAVLKVEDREFKVHRNILKVRSPVFASMFQPHTKESATGVVDIPDCSASAFEVFLMYTYTGSAEVISSDNVFNIYYVSDKYQMNDLKSECVEFMENNLSVENFCEAMSLCFRHSETRLQRAATRFFCDNVKKIIKTAEWQIFLKDFPTQANELFIKSINA